MSAHLLNLFQNLNLNPPLQVTSPQTDIYNCIGWAYSYPPIRIWPNQRYYWWPPGMRNDLHIDSFIELFTSIGYEICNDNSFENGFLKIALYTKPNGEPTHAARQLPNGHWTSKIGQLEDILHTIEGMDGGNYGNATVFMRRPI